MNYKMIGRFNAQILCIEAIFMLPALLICLLDTNMRAAWGFVMGIAALMIVSSLLFLLSRNAEKDFYAAEGMLSVSLGWILMSLLGCLPFVLSGEIPSYIDAFFEMVSGFTTTGASILQLNDIFA